MGSELGSGTLISDDERLSPEVLHVLRRVAEPYLKSLMASDDEEWCFVEYRRDCRYFICSRPKGHSGFHIAHYKSPNGELCEIDPWYGGNVRKYS